MPRSAPLKPTFRQDRVDTGRSPWCVSVPPHLSETGKRQQLFFSSRAEAKTACDLLKVRKSNFGNTLAAMSAARIAEASEAYKLLDPLGLGLLEAARSYVESTRGRMGSVTLGEAFDWFAESKQSKSPKYQKEIRLAKTTFEPLLSRKVCDLGHDDFEPLLFRLSASVRNAKLRRLRSVFNLAIRRKWAKENPVSALDFADTPRGEVEVFSVDAVRRLLEHALEHDLEFLPYRIFTFFCGIRPEGELERLEWSDVRLAEKLVIMRAEITKTRRKRFVELSDNAIEWLAEYQARGGTMAGLVAPWTEKVRGTKHRIGYRAVGIKKWIQQGARHSFCSYWLALHKDANKLVLQSGHTDADTMWPRYPAGVTEAEAMTYWAIRPPQAASNVIAMTA